MEKLNVQNKVACVVIGGYLNGYSIIQELFENKVENIILLDDKKDVAWNSHLLTDCLKIEINECSLLDVLITLHQKYGYLVIYPTKDDHLNVLVKIAKQISDFSYIGFDVQTATEYQKKDVQYKFCEKLGIPYPQTVYVCAKADLVNLEELQYPILIKPCQSVQEFRNWIINNDVELASIKTKIAPYLQHGIKFLFSELIPGEGDQIYAYMCYRSKGGNLLGEWTGKKLAQFPNNFGVFSSAKAVNNKELMTQGRKLVEGMHLTGLVEPEFKYDARDKTYKLMEVNLRSMMWNRVGALNGMPLHYIQYLDACGFPLPSFEFNATDTHYIYKQYELLNLLHRKEYYKIYKRNVYGGSDQVYALCQQGDERTMVRGWLLLIGKIFKKLKKYS